MNSEQIFYTKQFISKQLELRENGEKEDLLRHNQSSSLKLMFDPSTKWVRDHIEGIEKSVHLIRENRTVTGFVDSCIDSTAIEYERDLRIDSIYEEGYRQVKEYCASLIREGIDIEMILGILSDTLSWYIFEVVPTDNLLSSEYTPNNIVLKQIDSLEIGDASDNSAVALLNFLPKYLGREESRFVTGHNLARDFGLTSEYSKGYIDSISEFINKAIDQNKTYFQMVQKLWQNFVEGIDKTDDAKRTYIDEYYVSSLGKLLCANFIEKRALLSDDNELIQIINGTFFENRGFLNFVEFDYFGWLNTNERINDILATFHNIQHELVIYDFKKAPVEDLFGSILVQMSKNSHRLLLGQELTPQWLAKEVVDNVCSMLPEGVHPCFIDMCCGSGSMIIETLKVSISLISEDMERKDISKVLTRAATGFDIDPLAVTLAKINWIITVRDIVEKKAITDISIPIYHADSLFINTPVTHGSVFQKETLRMSMHDRQIDMPAFLISPENQSIFDEIVDTCYLNINTRLSNEVLNKLVINIIESNNSNVPDGTKEAMIEFASQFYDNMYDLNRRGQNGLWSFLIKNSFRPNLVSANFNGIVSNTPWLAMSKIASNPYKEELSAMAKYYNINPSGSSFLHLEMATVFLLHAIDRFLQNCAAFGCILPETVLAGKQHEKFRNGSYSRSSSHLKIDIAEIWNLPLNTFKNRAIAIFGYKKDMTSKEQIHGKNILSQSESVAMPFMIYNGMDRCAWSQTIISSSHGLYDSYSFQQGADILPRYLLFFELKDKGDMYEVNSINRLSQYAYFLPNMHVGKEYKLPLSKAKKSLFHQILLSNVVTPFVVGEMPLAFLPICESSNNGWRRMSYEEKVMLDRTDNNLISTIQEQFQKEKGDYKADFYDSINWRRKLEIQKFSNKGYLVVYGAGGKYVCAAYLNLSTFKTLPIVDQTLYWYVTQEEDEAIFITALLNSKMLTKSISVFQPKGKFGERHIHSLAATSLPSYNSENENHIAVVNATKVLLSELEENIGHNSDLYNPNKGPISARRKKISSLIEKFESYEEYERCCSEVL